MPFVQRRVIYYRLRWRDGARIRGIALGVTGRKTANTMRVLAASALTGRGAWPPELDGHPEICRRTASLAPAGPSCRIGGRAWRMVGNPANWTIFPTAACRWVAAPLIFDCWVWPGYFSLHATIARADRLGVQVRGGAETIRLNI